MTPKETDCYVHAGQQNGELNPLAGLNQTESLEAIPIELEAIVLKAIQKEKKDRYKSPAEFMEDIKRFLANKPVKAYSISKLSWLKNLFQN